jgi:hypothetical protein
MEAETRGGCLASFHSQILHGCMAILLLIFPILLWMGNVDFTTTSPKNP